MARGLSREGASAVFIIARRNRDAGTKSSNRGDIK
jgi:hypothetical protein